MRHTLSILLEKRCGELSRILGLFTARGYNIESLTLADTLDPSVSQMTLVTMGNDRAIEQLVKRIDKQVRVLKVMDLTGHEHIERNLALVKVKVEVGPALAEALNLVSVNRLRLIDASEDSFTFEATGNWDQVSEVIRLLTDLGIRDIARSGALALTGREKTAGANHLAAATVNFD